MAKVAKSQRNAKEFRSAWRVHDGCAGHSGIGNRTRSVIGLFLHEDIRRSTIPVDVRRPRYVDSVNGSCINCSSWFAHRCCLPCDDKCCRILRLSLFQPGSHKIIMHFIMITALYSIFCILYDTIFVILLLHMLPVVAVAVAWMLSLFSATSLTVCLLYTLKG